MDIHLMFKEGSRTAVKTGVPVKNQEGDKVPVIQGNHSILL